jgi:hypothetical protein
LISPPTQPHVFDGTIVLFPITDRTAGRLVVRGDISTGLYETVGTGPAHGRAFVRAKTAEDRKRMLDDEGIVRLCTSIRGLEERLLQ